MEEVEATFQMRGLGIVPQLTGGAGAPMLLGVGDDTGDRNLVENFRVVRTNLLAMGTSARPSCHDDHQRHAQGGQDRCLLEPGHVLRPDRLAHASH